MANIVITGANRGIGLELTRQLRASKHTVWAVCRRASSALEGTGATIISGIDVTEDAGAAAIVAELGELRVDVLINNAGILERDNLESSSWASLQRQFEVNAIAPLRITRALLPRMVSGAKVAIITSRMGSIADNGSGGYYGYRMSKAAVNMAGMSLARDLAPRGVAVALLHPGMVATDMTGGHGVPVAEAAAGLVARIEGLSMANTGTFWHANGEILPW